MESCQESPSTVYQSLNDHLEIHSWVLMQTIFFFHIKIDVDLCLKINFIRKNFFLKSRLYMGSEDFLFIHSN